MSTLTREPRVIGDTDIGAVPAASGELPSPESPRGSWGTRRLHLTPDGWALVAVVAAVLIANLPYLLGFFDPNPLDARSGLTSAVTPGLLGGKPTIDPSNGFTSQAIGHLAALDILHLRLPWWNPYEATGMPLLGESQSAALFPLTLLTAFSNGQLYEHILLELIAGVCTYLLLRRLALVRAAAVAAAIAFALNGKFAWFADAGVNPVPFLPMLLLGVERAYAAARSGRRAGWRLLALAGALSVYAGFPEVAYIDAIMALAWVAWRSGCLPRGKLRPFAAKVALGAGAGTLLAAPALVAMGTYLNHADLGIHASNQLGSVHLTLSALPQLLAPYVYGPINGDPNATTWIGVGGYLTTTLLVLAGLGAVSSGRRGLRLVLLGLGLLVFARIYGQPPLLGHVLGLLPGMSHMEFYRYGTAVLELAVIVLAALGLDDLIRVPEHRLRAVWATLMVVGLVAGAALGARPVVHGLSSNLHHGAYLTVSILWGAIIAIAVGLGALLRGARARAALLTLFVALDAVVLFAVPEFSAPRVATLDRAPVAYLRTHLGEARFATLGPIAPDYGSYFGLASLGVDDFPPQRYADYVRARLDPWVAFTGFRSSRAPSQRSELLAHLDGYRLAGVRYVLTRAGQPLPRHGTGLSLVLRTATTRIYQLAGAADYFTATGCRISSGGRYSTLVVCPRPSTLVRRETYLAGWSARLDGHATPIRPFDGLFQAVALPAGSHRITFSFAPPGIDWALLGFVAGCALMLAPTARRRTRAKAPA